MKQKKRNKNKAFSSPSAENTRNFAKQLARDIATQLHRRSRGALVLGLQGVLGSGKTTFAQGFAQGLGIQEKILSPTFVIIKSYRLHDSRFAFHALYHIDCYRIGKPQELLELGWQEIVSNPKNIVLVEWADRIKKILPRNTIFISFETLKQNTRKISFPKDDDLSDVRRPTSNTPV